MVGTSGVEEDVGGGITSMLNDLVTDKLRSVWDRLGHVEK